MAIIRIIGLILLNALLISLVVFAFNHLPEYIQGIDQEPESEIVGLTDGSAPTFKIITLYLGPNSRHFFNCQPECQEITIPSSIEGESVTDGTSWYSYKDSKSSKGESIKTLQRLWPDQDQSTTIIEQTDLVKPRSLHISPDNLKVAYWLDNITNIKKSLTELWVYDSSQGGTKVVAEKLNRNDILTKPRWNMASNYLWFLGNKDDPKFHLVSIQPPSLHTRFNNVDWSELIDIAGQGPMDISFTGDSLAYTKSPPAIMPLGRHQLVVVHDGDEPKISHTRSPIIYLRWLPDSSLLYITQDSRGFTLWRQIGAIHKHLARHTGQLSSVKMDPTGQYLILLTPEKSQVTALHFSIEDQKFISEQALPNTNDAAHLIHVEAIDTLQPSQNISNELPDNQITAFIENNLGDITTISDPKPLSIVFTDQPNTVFLVVKEPDQPKQRFLLTINDAVHSEWTIISKYLEQGGDWTRTHNGTLKEPTPTELYDWEPSLNQWILKKTF